MSNPFANWGKRVPKVESPQENGNEDMKNEGNAKQKKKRVQTKRCEICDVLYPSRIKFLRHLKQNMHQGNVHKLQRINTNNSKLKSKDHKSRFKSKRKYKSKSNLKGQQ